MNITDQNITIMNRINLTKIERFLFKNGEYQIPYTEDLLKFSHMEIVQFANKYAMYTLPTLELVDWFQKMIGDAKAIEIGSGCGVLGKGIGIRCTDNFCQERQDVKAYYNLVNQPTISYGKHVEKRDAEWVACKWQPDIIVGSWITHKWVDDDIQGNYWGPDEEILLDNCHEYIMLGHEKIHRRKPIMKHNPLVIKSEDCPWYVSRSVEPKGNCIYIWRGRKKWQN